MGDKYYTPEIEEFCVGFEFELREGVIWNKITSDIQIQYALHLQGRVLKDFIRVKYLDGEDIESLGFKRLTDDCYNLPVKEFRGRLDQEVRIIVRKTILIYLAMGVGDKDNMVLFTGNIKNLSEFKVLLKQLNIK